MLRTSVYVNLRYCYCAPNLFFGSIPRTAISTTVQVVFKHHGQFSETGTTWVTRVTEVFLLFQFFYQLREFFLRFTTITWSPGVHVWCESWFIFCPEELCNFGSKASKVYLQRQQHTISVRLCSDWP